jgi:hypothetical protein
MEEWRLSGYKRRYDKNIVVEWGARNDIARQEWGRQLYINVPIS